MVVVMVAVVALLGMAAADDGLIYQSSEPPQTKSAALCEACHAAIDQASKAFGARKPAEWEVLEFLEVLCVREKMNIYGMIPPKMIKACREFMESYDEATEKFLNKVHEADTELEYDFCHVELEVCEGIDYSRRKYEDRGTRYQSLRKMADELDKIIQKTDNEMVRRLAGDERKAAEDALAETKAWLAENSVASVEVSRQYEEIMQNKSGGAFPLDASIKMRERLALSVKSAVELNLTNYEDNEDALARWTDFVEKGKELEIWLSDAENLELSEQTYKDHMTKLVDIRNIAEFGPSEQEDEVKPKKKSKKKSKKKKKSKNKKGKKSAAKDEL